MNKVNLNENAYFKLTETGNKIIEIYIKETSELIRSEYKREYVVKTDKNGMEYMQLWEFMKIFGGYFHNGSNPVIENNNLFFK